MTRGRTRLTRDEAETLAIGGLQFLAANEEHLTRFMALTGIAPEELRDAAMSDDFLSGVLDYFMGDEATLLAFAASRGIDPAQVGAARALLSGGDAGL